MKKLLLGTAAVCGLAVAATPAQAELALDLGGYMKGYVLLNDQDNDTGVAGEARELDVVRETEVHLSGETTLDNGLTVGFHAELEADSSPNNNTTDGVFDESYAYFSGGWGRVNFGSEDGAAYLLQVAAPSADSNVDGIRQYINPVNYTAAGDATLGTLGGFDYEQNLSAKDDKITYLSPVFSGFQFGVSYTPELGDASNETTANVNDQDNDLGAVYDLSARYEGMVGDVGVTLGAGYSQADLEEATAIADGDMSDDRTAWNVGADLDIGPFGLGVSYSEDDYGQVATAALGATKMDDEQTWVVGADYTTGPFKLGVSYFDQENSGAIDGNVATEGVDTQRTTAGVVYTYGPGMTFRGSVSMIEHDNVPGLTNGTEVEATSVLVGTQIKF